MGFIHSPSASEAGHTYIPVTKSEEWKKERGKEGNVTVEVEGGAVLPALSPILLQLCNEDNTIILSN
jgi:hypothetical protein